MASSAFPDDVLARLRARLLGYAARRGRREAAEDLVQEAMLLLATKYASVTGPEDLVRLGVTTLRYKMMAFRRKERRRGEDRTVDPGDAGLPDHGPDPEAAAERRQLLEQLRAAVQRLEGRCREIVRLKLEDRSFPEIADILSAKLNTVYSWDHRCMESLRTMLRGEGGR